LSLQDVAANVKEEHITVKPHEMDLLGTTWPYDPELFPFTYSNPEESHAIYAQIEGQEEPVHLATVVRGMTCRSE
jgi:hypothetical protein